MLHRSAAKVGRLLSASEDVDRMAPARSMDTSIAESRFVAAPRTGQAVDALEPSQFGPTDKPVQTVFDQQLQTPLDALDTASANDSSHHCTRGAVHEPERGRPLRLLRAPGQEAAAFHEEASSRSNGCRPGTTPEVDASLSHRTVGATPFEMQIDEIIVEVVALYEVEVVAVAVQRSGVTELIASRGLEVTYLDWKEEGSCNQCFDLFRHSVNRDLPIIIEDAAQDEKVRGDSLVTTGPHIRFCASLPFGFSGVGQYKYTLSIASATPRGFCCRMQRCSIEVPRRSDVCSALARMSIARLRHAAWTQASQSRGSSRRPAPARQSMPSSRRSSAPRTSRPT